MNGAPLSVKRCFALGYFLPVNSKVEDRTAPCAGRRKAEGHRRKLDPIAGGPHHGSRIANPDVVGLRQVALALFSRRAEGEPLHHLAILSPLHMLLVVVAHPLVRHP